MSAELTDFFKLISEEKKRNKEEFRELVGDLDLTNVFAEISNLKKEDKKVKVKEEKKVDKKKEEKALSLFENLLKDPEEPQPEVVEETQEAVQDWIGDVVLKEGLLNTPPSERNSDPLTPLDQEFATLEDLSKHYRIFINRIQEQLSTLGGGGEVRLEFLDDLDRDTALQSKKLIAYSYDESTGKGTFIGTDHYDKNEVLNLTLQMQLFLS
jgi:hypothetical protein|tara:strand:- start:4140 stop:4772 length:633 start_codon:yes stop_codon:yes gene_type:complete